MSGIDLYDYQMDAVKKMKNGCILCGGVGSGKSRTALAYYYLQNGGMLFDDYYITMNDPPKDLYIITTARKRDTKEWEGELSPFLLSVHTDINLYSNKVTVDSWNNIKKYSDVEKSFFIFDEQRVVGSGAWVKSFLKIAKKNEWILLSATPGDNWLDYIPVFVANGFYRNPTEFKREHVVYKNTDFPKVDFYINVGRLIRLRNKILVTMDFKRSTVPHHSDIFVSYDVQRYKDILKTRTTPFEQGYFLCDENASGALCVGTDIQATDVIPIFKNFFFEPNIGDYVRIAGKPLLNAGELCYTLRRVVNSDESRQEAVLEIKKSHKRVIIFYNFDYELEILSKLNYGKNTEIACWNGHKHQPIPESDDWVYLVQYNAGAEGWNCIKTDTVIFYSQNYSYKTMVQASGRIDRLNTPYTELYYYHLKSRSGIDIAISKALSEKKKFNETGYIKQTAPYLFGDSLR